MENTHLTEIVAHDVSIFFGYLFTNSKDDPCDVESGVIGGSGLWLVKYIKL